jgi:hypothetical protein
VTAFDTETRHYCRNPRCRSKLPAPVANAREAFCARGCFESFYRSHCGYAMRRLSGGPSIKNSAAGRAARAISGLIQRKASKSADFIGSKQPLKTDRPAPWAWRPLSEDDDWELLDAQGKQRARVRIEGDQYWVSYPRCFPEPTLESLEEASRRAVSLAFATLPNPRQPYAASTAARAERRLISNGMACYEGNLHEEWT